MHCFALAWEGLGYGGRLDTQDFTYGLGAWDFDDTTASGRMFLCIARETESAGTLIWRLYMGACDR